LMRLMKEKFKQTFSLDSLKLLKLKEMTLES